MGNAFIFARLCFRWGHRIHLAVKLVDEVSYLVYADLALVITVEELEHGHVLLLVNSELIERSHDYDYYYY